MSDTAQNGFNIQASLFFAPENIHKVFAALKPVYEKTTAENDCLSFQVYQSLDDPGQILLVEDWLVQAPNPVKMAYYRSHRS
jgi:quinol monooxygenase YgiN